jgi:superfamily I DNA and/or RNA helicase
MKKVPGIKVIFEEPKIAMSTRDKEVLFNLGEEFMDILIRGTDSPKEQGTLDELLNKTFGFVDVSKPSIKWLGVNFSKDYLLNKNPTEAFFDRAAVADFNAKSKMVLTPVGFALKGERGKDHSTLVMFSYNEKDETTDLGVAEIRKDMQGPPWDILRRGGESVADIKEKVLAAVGAKERRSA